ncbi:MAG TPA: type IX secretion system outer membrane channel protein PorV [Saprospiraceae bacterium]|nr:type IX secretion system outer membrane channel protein PorV [Saprospiraceae bacterium]HMU02189.1 type IX secretion system outer membrane channel protein PorV [Saprospiraceae bacterium]
MNNMFKYLLLCVVIISPLLVKGQSVFDPAKFCVTDNNGDCISNTLLTAVPFLRLTPDARAGAMGDVGIALDPDANSMHFNASNLVFAKDESGFSFTYTPWLRNLNLDDIFLLYISGFYKLDENQAIGGGIRFFSLGDIDFTDIQGGSLGTGRPREGEFSLAYARKLGDKLSASLTGKYIFSNLASGLNVSGQDIITGTAFAADFGLNYRTKTNLGGYKGEWSYGLSLTNIGSKISYTRDNIVRDFIPSNFGLGTALKLDLDQYNSLTIALDFNKLMVPTPIAAFIRNSDGSTDPNPEWDKNNNKIADYREKALFSGMLGSFGDAQGGVREELKEVSIGLGLEYWYDKQFAFRGGYYYESAEKGNRRYFTVGAGIKYNVFGINLSYLIPTSVIPNPLDNTLRFSLLFDFSVFKADE